jgi:hypothetical protein
MQKELEAWLITQSVMVGETQLARLVMDALGDSIRARNELIELAIERFDSGDFSADQNSEEDKANRGVIGESSAPGVSTPPRPTESRGPMWPWGLGLVAAAGAALFIVTRAPTDAPVVPPAGAVVTSVKPSEKVKIRVTTNPEHATVTVDGETRETPFTIEVDKDDRVREVMIAKKDYLTRVERLQFDKTQDVTYQLQQQEVAAVEIPATTTTALEPKAPVEKKGTKPGRKPDDVTASVPQPAPAAQPAPATKPPTRILDTQNPF